MNHDSIALWFDNTSEQPGKWVVTDENKTEYASTNYILAKGQAGAIGRMRGKQVIEIDRQGNQRLIPTTDDPAKSYWEYKAYWEEGGL